MRKFYIRLWEVNFFSFPSSGPFWCFARVYILPEMSYVFYIYKNCSLKMQPNLLFAAIFKPFLGPFNFFLNKNISQRNYTFQHNISHGWGRVYTFEEYLPLIIFWPLILCQPIFGV